MIFSNLVPGSVNLLSFLKSQSRIIRKSYWYSQISFQDQPNSERPDPLALSSAVGKRELAVGAKTPFFCFCSKGPAFIIWPAAKPPVFSFLFKTLSLYNLYELFWFVLKTPRVYIISLRTPLPKFVRRVQLLSKQEYFEAI